MTDTTISHLLYILDSVIEESSSGPPSDYGQRVQAVRDIVQAECPECEPEEPPPVS